MYTWKKLMWQTLSLDLTVQGPKHLHASGTSLLHQDKRASDMLDIAFLMRKAKLQSIASQQKAPTPYCRPDVPIHRMCRSARADKSWEQVASSSAHGRCQPRWRSSAKLCAGGRSGGRKRRPKRWLRPSALWRRRRMQGQRRPFRRPGGAGGKVRYTLNVPFFLSLQLCLCSFVHAVVTILLSLPINCLCM